MSSRTTHLMALHNELPAPIGHDSALTLSAEPIERRIFTIRGNRIMLDNDLAQLYGVTTFNLNKAVKRNIGRFPEDFMFQLSAAEHESLIFQFGISKPAGRGGRRFLPYAFTQEGVAMLSSVLRSDRAVQVNVAIMRAFVRIREIAASHKDLTLKLNALEQKYDGQFRVVFDAIRRLMDPPRTKRRPIGFRANR